MTIKQTKIRTSGSAWAAGSKWTAPAGFCAVTLALGIVGACGMQSAMADPSPATPPVIGNAPVTPTADQSLLLTVVASDGTEKVDPTGARYDFGKLGALDDAKIEHTFTLHNGNAVPIIVTKVPPTCGCTNVVIEGSADQKFPITVQPGQDIHIHTAIDRGHLTGGSFVKNVLVYLEGHGTPSHTLELRGTMHAAVTVTPDNIDFGRVHVGNTPSSMLELSMDPKMVAGGWKPKVTCSVPGINVKELKTIHPAPGATGDAAYEIYQYRLSVDKHMKIGTFWAQLVVSTNPALDAKAAGAPRYANPRQFSMHPNYGNIHGEVFGDITASPTNVSFGSVTSGAPSRQSVTITGTSPGAIRDLEIKSISPWVKVTTSPLDPKTPTVEVVNLELSPSAPAGSFQSEVSVHSKKGGDMSIMVLGYVMAAAATTK